jgi:hypothetical protein
MNPLLLALVMAASPAPAAPPEPAGTTLSGGAVVEPAIAGRDDTQDPAAMLDRAVRDYDVVPAGFDPATPRPIA